MAQQTVTTGGIGPEWNSFFQHTDPTLLPPVDFEPLPAAGKEKADCGCGCGGDGNCDDRKKRKRRIVLGLVVFAAAATAAYFIFKK